MLLSVSRITISAYVSSPLVMAVAVVVAIAVVDAVPATPSGCFLVSALLVDGECCECCREQPAVLVGFAVFVVAVVVVVGVVFVVAGVSTFRS